MANVYVHSGAAGANTGVDWTNAFTNLSSISTKAAGDVIYVAHDHAQSQASGLVITSPGTEVTPCRIYCVDRAGSVPPVAADLRTTATVTTTGAANITLSGTVSECYGITFSAGDAANSATIFVCNTASRTWRIVNCALVLGGNSSLSRINCASGSAANSVFLENTTLQFSNVGQRVIASGRVFWRNTTSAIAGATIPTDLLSFGGSVPGSWFVEGVDLSALGSGKTLVKASDAAPNTAILKDCKLGTSVTVAVNNSISVGGPDVVLIRCDSGDTNYRTEKYAFAGTLTTETTIVRSGGASDGATPIAWKIVTTSVSRWEMPFESLPITIWNETVGSAITVTIECIWDGGAVPNNDEIFIDVEYLGTSGFPIASKATSTKATGLATGTAISAGSGTWGGSTTKFAMSATLTPQEKGPLTIYVRAAKVSSTFYIDPKPVIT